MYDINKILDKFKTDLQSKTMEEKVAYLRSYGFSVNANKIEAADNLLQNKGEHMIQEKGTISFCRDKYKTEEEFWKAVGDQLKILTTNNYEVLFRYEDCGVYTLDYVYNPDTGYGDDRFVLLTEEEEENLYLLRSAREKNDGEQA